MPKNSILCPSNEHKDHAKILCIPDGERLYLYCRRHGWIGLSFSRGGIPMSFDNVAVEATDIKSNHYFDNLTPLPMVAKGRFKRIK
jgi:hypothetical protein